MKSLIFILIAFWGMGNCPSQAQETVTFGPGETKIVGAIPYSLIGNYRARFSDFKGRITLDDNSRSIRSVNLEIEAGSIKSNHPWLDRLARSRKLLNTARYPKIIFNSDKIIHDDNGYQVHGVLEMHGIKKRLAFPFKAVFITDQNTRREVLDLKGTWSINRKDFDIIWNKYLDRGGIVVGDFLTVDWGIRTYIN
jgi:polyisoprenoid-binding protein YceI